MRRGLLIVAGFAALAAGAIGIVLPVLPTTPFVLVAAACFSRASPRFDAWLLRSRVFGPFIDNHRTGRGVSRWHKYGSIAFLWAVLVTSIIAVDPLWLKLLLVVIGVGVSVHLFSLRTRKPTSADTSPPRANCP